MDLLEFWSIRSDKGFMTRDHLWRVMIVIGRPVAVQNIRSIIELVKQASEDIRPDHGARD